MRLISAGSLVRAQSGPFLAKREACFVTRSALFVLVLSESRVTDNESRNYVSSLAEVWFDLPGCRRARMGLGRIQESEEVNGFRLGNFTVGIVLAVVL